ncbi:helix-turn-helix transcriptional regulator [Anaerotignum propionicum]|uniref:helix-turn-helix domain-containing protein n=1 Tax=Anaerotignum propionicum TaxID=28446 RepID=UPI00289D26D7|nr:helix-turn-helix transcriptional regulator [Anaerotignum propionicum]
MSIRGKLREVRIKLGFTQKDIAEKAGLAIITIQGYEANKFNPKLETLDKIAEALNVSVYCFLQQAEEQLPLTLEELESRVDPVWHPFGEALGYWCLCQQGRIMPPSGLGFIAKDRPDWLFYGCKPIEFNQIYEKQIECDVFNETENKGNRIRKIRKKRNLTQKQLGELCGIDEANIRKYELGKQNPRYETLEKIANALTVPISYFLKK